MKKINYVNMINLAKHLKDINWFSKTHMTSYLRALKIWTLYKYNIFQVFGKIFCVEFQRYPLKFHTKYLTYTLKDVHFIHRWKFKSS